MTRMDEGKNSNKEKTSKTFLNQGGTETGRAECILIELINSIFPCLRGQIYFF